MLDVIIVVPVYKEDLSATERGALQQLFSVLRKYPVAFVAPERMRLFFASRTYRVEFFPDDYFRSTVTYSKMLLSSEFYERFLEYEYMLIYHLDAFVFSDKLLEFCAMGYDYIGAPVSNFWPAWRDISCNVGSGGFSLRKIVSALRVVEQKEQIFSMRPSRWKENYFLRWEDIFFAFSSTIPSLDFHVPNTSTALSFAVGADLWRVYRRMPAWLPFGCHGWSRTKYAYWKPVFESQGIILPARDEDIMQPDRKSLVKDYLVLRLVRDRAKAKRVLDAFFDGAASCALWGWGKYGTVAYELILASGRKISCIFDRGAEQEASVAEIPVRQPTDAEIEALTVPILISTLDHEKEIRTILISKGMKESKDFFLLSKLFSKIWSIYPFLSDGTAVA